jgi:hypothetical protein
MVMWVCQKIVVDDESMIDGTDDNRVTHLMNPKMTMIMTWMSTVFSKQNVVDMMFARAMMTLTNNRVWWS